MSRFWIQSWPAEKRIGSREWKSTNGTVPWKIEHFLAISLGFAVDTRLFSFFRYIGNEESREFCKQTHSYTSEHRAHFNPHLKHVFVYILIYVWPGGVLKAAEWYLENMLLVPETVHESNKHSANAYACVYFLHNGWKHWKIISDQFYIINNHFC